MVVCDQIAYPRLKGSWVKNILNKFCFLLVQLTFILPLSHGFAGEIDHELLWKIDLETRFDDMPLEEGVDRVVAPGIVHLKKDLRVAGNRLCHDNMYIYFETKSDCVKSGSPVSCEGRMEIVPIREVENVRAPFIENDQTVIYELNRIFKVETIYPVTVFHRYPDGTLVKAGQENAMIPFCCELGQHPDSCNRPQIQDYETNEGAQKYVASTRVAVNQIEKKLIRSMDRQGARYVYLPQGGESVLKQLDLDEHSPGEDYQVQFVNLTTPFCNPKLKRPVMLAGGEDSGGGADSKSGKDDEEEMTALMMGFDDLIKVATGEVSVAYMTKADGETEVLFNCLGVEDI